MEKKNGRKSHPYKELFFSPFLYHSSAVWIRERLEGRIKGDEKKGKTEGGAGYEIEDERI